MARRDACEHPRCPGTWTREGEHRPGRFDLETGCCRSCGAGEHWRVGSASDWITNLRWQQPGTFRPELSPRKRTERTGRRKRTLNRRLRLRGEQKHDLRIFPRQEYLDPVRAELIELSNEGEGFSIIDSGATGAPAYRPKKGIQAPDKIAREEWDAIVRACERIRSNPWAAQIVGWNELSTKRQERLCQALRLAEMQNVNIDAFVRSYRGEYNRRTVYRLRKSGQEEWGTLMQQKQTLEALERMERKLDQVLADCADTVQRIRERFPTDAEVSEAVDRFLDEISAQPSQKAAESIVGTEVPL